MRPGDVVANKYRIERLLGEGGMGAVYVAVNEKLQKRVALKLLRAELAGSADAAHRMTREAIAASRARHPGIVEIYDADSTDGVTWIAMELLEGESLGARMSRGRLPASEAIALVCDTLDALAAVHRVGIVHRDLKPDNLFLARLPNGTSRVKVLDFGIAASVGPELARVTQTGVAIGTPMYFAPEQASGERNLDPRVDVYAMGAILFELLSGRVPYRADSLGALVREMFTRGPPALSEIEAGVPRDLSDFVAACLAVDRERRVASAEAMKHGLETLTMSATGPLSSPPAIAQLAPGPAPMGSAPMGSAPMGSAPMGSAPMGSAPTPGAAPSPARPPSSGRWIVLAVLGALAALVMVSAVAVALYFGVREPTPAEPVALAPPPPTAMPEPEPVVPAPVEAAPVEAAPAEVIPVATPATELETAPAESPQVADEPPRRRTRRGRSRAAPAAEPRVETPPAPPAPAREPDARPIPNNVWVQVLQRHEAQLDGCYYQHFTSAPRPRVVTRVTMQVATDGAVRSVAVAGAPNPLGRCLERALRRARFPANPWPSRGTFQMTLYDTP